jgi:hypothetical protein
MSRRSSPLVKALADELLARGLPALLADELIKKGAGGTVPGTTFVPALERAMDLKYQATRTKVSIPPGMRN